MPKLDPNVVHHPAVVEQFEKRTSDAQLRLADKITTCARSFLSTFVMIGQNRQGAFQQAKSDRDYRMSTRSSSRTRISPVRSTR